MAMAVYENNLAEFRNAPDPFNRPKRRALAPLFRLGLAGIFSTSLVLISVSSVAKFSETALVTIAPASVRVAEAMKIAPASANEKSKWYNESSARQGAIKFGQNRVILSSHRLGYGEQGFAPAAYFEPVTFKARLLSGWRDELPSIFQEFDGPLGRFRGKLAQLQDGTLKRPLVIVHIGDSHIASDSFSRGIRRRLQSRFGNAGRGAVIPSNAFKYAIADGVKLSSAGSWRSILSLKSSKGIFGISGVRRESGSRSASMTLTAKRSFDYAQVTLATGPNQGSFDIKIDGTKKRFSAKSAIKGAKTFKLAARGKKLSVHPAGNGKVSVLHWSTGRDMPGIRYVNFGQVGATVKVTKRWNEAALKNDLAELNPDLVIFGFGTNDGFDDHVNVEKYKQYVTRFLEGVRENAPQADLMVIGASSGLRRKRGISCGNGWFIPPKLGAIRQSMKELSSNISAGFWDWSKHMGGDCGIDQWAKNGFAAKDRVHLSPKGYERSAKAFVSALTGPLDTPLLVATIR